MNPFQFPIQYYASIFIICMCTAAGHSELHYIRPSRACITFMCATAERRTVFMYCDRMHTSVFLLISIQPMHNSCTNFHVLHICHYLYMTCNHLMPDLHISASTLQASHLSCTSFHFKHVCYDLNTGYNLTHTPALLLLSLQALHHLCTNLTFCTRLLRRVYKLQYHAYLYTSVSYCTNVPHFRHKLCILHISAATCICGAISYLPSTSLIEVCKP